MAWGSRVFARDGCVVPTGLRLRCSKGPGPFQALRNHTVNHYDVEIPAVIGRGRGSAQNSPSRLACTSCLAGSIILYIPRSTHGRVTQTTNLMWSSCRRRGTLDRPSPSHTPPLAGGFPCVAPRRTLAHPFSPEQGYARPIHVPGMTLCTKARVGQGRYPLLVPEQHLCHNGHLAA